MKKAFSLFELTIVIIVISIIAGFIIQKSNESIEFTNKTKIKAEIALIRNSISKQKTSNILLNEESTFTLDDASIEEEQSKLFNKILDFPLLSTNSLKKDVAKWIKVSQNEYKVFISLEESLEFSFENSTFLCKSEVKLCKEYE